MIRLSSRAIQSLESLLNPDGTLNASDPHGTTLTQTNLNITNGIRLDNGKYLKYRNGANTVDLDVLTVASTNKTQLYGFTDIRLICGISSGGNIILTGEPTSKIGIMLDTPTARLHLPAGTATANTAPLKFTGGAGAALLTAVELGAVEFTDNGTAGNLYMTTNVAAVVTRREVLLGTGWTSYTPAVTSETGGWTNYTATGFYRVVDKILTVSFRVVFSAASGVVDGMLISLPTGLTMNASVMAGGAGWDATPVGCAVLADNGTVSGVPAMITTRTNQIVLVKYYNAAATSYLTGVGLTNTNPWTWAASDEVVGEFTVPIL